MAAKTSDRYSGRSAYFVRYICIAKARASRNFGWHVPTALVLVILQVLYIPNQLQKNSPLNVAILRTFYFPNKLSQPHDFSKYDSRSSHVYSLPFPYYILANELNKDLNLRVLALIG